MKQKQNAMSAMAKDLEAMDRYEFFDYILANFNISCETSRLIDNILTYIESACLAEKEQHKILHQLLCGDIGISDEEIEKVCI